MNVRRKYTGLGLVALLFEIIAWIALILSVAFAVWFWFQDFSVRIMDFATFIVPHWVGFLALPFGIVTFLQFYVLGSVLSLLIDVEFNTRANVTVSLELIKAVESLRLRESSQPSPTALSATPPPPPPPPPTETVEPAPMTPPVQDTEPFAPPPSPEPVQGSAIESERIMETSASPSEREPDSEPPPAAD